MLKETIESNKAPSKFMTMLEEKSIFVKDQMYDNVLNMKLQDQEKLLQELRKLEREVPKLRQEMLLKLKEFRSEKTDYVKTKEEENRES
jgi:hypothetical protein